MIFICCRHHISLMILSLGLCCYFGIEESFFVASVNPSSIRRQCHQSSWLSVSRQNAILKYRGGEKGENEPEDEDKQASEEEVKIADTATDKNTNDSFEILEEKVVYSGWRTIVQRMIRLRNGKVANFDVSPELSFFTASPHSVQLTSSFFFVRMTRNETHIKTKKNCTVSISWLVSRQVTVRY